MSKKDKGMKKDKAAAEAGQEVTHAAGSGNGTDTTAAEGTKKGSSAPRARKWDYGITPEARVTRLVEAATAKRDIAAQFAHTEGNPTVAEFYTKGGDRHGLRVMMRRKLISLVHEDTGATFPIAYLKPEPKPEVAAEAAAA